MSVLNYIEELFTKEENKNFDKNGTVMKATIILIIASILLFAIGMAIGYYQDEIKEPSFNEHSYFAPSKDYMMKKDSILWEDSLT